MKRCTDPSRLRWTIRRMQEHIEEQEKFIRELQAENRAYDARDCRHVNDARAALAHLGEVHAIWEAQELDRWLKIDMIALLCEIVRNQKVEAMA